MLLKWIPVLALSAVVAACGGGGDGGLGTDGTDSAASETGFFIDSRVSGLTWVTQFNGQNTGIGTTSFNGAFPYLQGETVTFRIGDLELGTVQASAYITPLTLAGTTNTSNPFVVNLARLLQSLDTDDNPDNGITLPTNLPSLAGLDLQQDTVDFENQFAATYATRFSPAETLIPPQDAIDHLELSVNAIPPGPFAARFFGNWRIFSSAQGADGEITFSSQGSQSGGTLTLVEAESCAPGARANVYAGASGCTTVPLRGSWLYSESLEGGLGNITLRIDDLGDIVTDRCEVLRAEAGFIELECQEQVPDGEQPLPPETVYLTRDVEDTATKPSALDVQLFSNLAPGSLEEGNPWLELGPGVFRFDSSGIPISFQIKPVYAIDYNESTGILSYTTSAPSPTPQGEVPQPISRPNSCRLYNGMVLEGVGNRAFYARCGVSTEIWILSPNT